MRISDWSSDVCSSDLGFLPQGRSTPETPLHCGCLDPDAPSASAAPAATSGSRASTEASFRTTGAAGRSPSARCLRSSSGRSEEHTSELQSLMRISYAVFCLKKKKQKKNTIIKKKKRKQYNK